MSEDGITMTKVGGETGIATVLDSGTVGTKVGGTIGLIKKEGETLSYSSDGKSWTPLSGGGGAFDLVKVAKYEKAFQTITELTLSGLTDHEDMDGEMLELSAANGFYLLYTDGDGVRYPIYKHKTGEFYLTTIGFNDDFTEALSPAKLTDRDVNWFLSPSSAAEESLSYLKSQNLESGLWDNPMMMYSDNVVITPVSGSAEEITVQKATGYDAAQDAYMFDGTDVTASGSQFTPKPHGVYAMRNSRLIGDPVGSEYGNFCRAYIEGTVLPKKDNQAYATVLTPEWGEYMVGALEANFQLVKKAGIDVTELTGSSGIGARDIYQYPHTYHGDFTDLTLSAAFWGGDEGISNKFTSVVGFGRYGGGGICIAINWYNPITVLGVLGEALSTEYCYKFENSSIVNSWHHAAITYTGSKQQASLYVDGVLRGTFSGPIKYEAYRWMYFGGNGGGDEIGGCRREIKLWNIALNPDQVQAEFERCKAILNITPIS